MPPYSTLTFPAQKVELTHTGGSACPVTLKHWLSLVIESAYEVVERSDNEVFWGILAKDEGVVDELLFELGFTDLGHVVRDVEELGVYLN